MDSVWQQLPSTGAVSGWNCSASGDLLAHAKFLTFCGPQDHRVAHEQPRFCDQIEIGIILATAAVQRQGKLEHRQRTRRHVDTAGPLQHGPGKHIRSLYPQSFDLWLKAVDSSVLRINYDLQIIRIAALMSSISMYLV